MKKKMISYLVIALVTILVLYFSLRQHFNEIIDTLVNMNKLWIILAFLVMVICWLLKTIPVHLFCKEYKSDFKYEDSLLLILRTQFANAVTPFATGGQPYQVYFLNKKGIDVGKSTGIILQNFIVYQIALVFLGVVALVSNLIFKFLPNNGLLIKLTALGFIINFIVICFSFLLAFAKRFIKWLIRHIIGLLNKMHIVKDKDKKIKSWGDSIANFHDSSIMLMKNWKLFLGTIFINLIYLCLLYSIPFFVLVATGKYGEFANVTFGTTIMVSAYVMLIGSFVPIPGGTGGLEGAYKEFFGTILDGYRGPITNSTMIIWRTITYFFGLIVGGIAFNISEKKVKKCE